MTVKWSLQFSLQLSVRVKPVVKTSTSLVAKDLGPPDLSYTQKSHGYSNLRTEDEECDVIPNWC